MNSVLKTLLLNFSVHSCKRLRSGSCQFRRPIFSKLVHDCGLFRDVCVASSARHASTLAKSVKVESHPKKEPVTMKIDSPEFHSLFTPELKKLAEVFQSRGFEIRMAGGAVRDLMMNKKPDDIDFATTATPEQMKTFFTEDQIRMFNTRGESHGTISVRINDKENFEITTLRIDVTTDGRHAQVEFTTDWYLDASRRDLTINSMFLGLDGTLYDYFNGIEDMKSKTVKFVGNPVKRMQEDYLRILRYFRFHGRVVPSADDHNPETLEAIKENANGLAKIAGERCWSELKKILLGSNKFELLKTMFNLGILVHLGIPATANVKELDKLQKRSENLSLHPVTILVSLLENEEEFAELHRRLKFSGFERDLGFTVILYRDMKSTSVDPLRPYQEMIVDSTSQNQTDIVTRIQEILKYKGEGDLIKQLEKWEIPKFPVKGTSLMERGIAGGRRFNHIFTVLKKKWIQSGFTMTEDKLLESLDEVIHEVDQHGSPKLDKRKLGNKKVKK